MKKHLLLFFSLCLFTKVYAQKFELNVDAYSGLFHYGGDGTATTSFIETGTPNYTYDPYGNKNGFSYGAGLRLQYVTKGGFIIGAGADYEILRSRVDVSVYQPIYYTINEDSGPEDIQTLPSTTGHTALRSQNINISPFIGYRIMIKKTNIDLMSGIDLGFNINSYDKGSATDGVNNTYSTNVKLANSPTDLRLRFGAAAGYGRFGFTASYAYGLTNLYKSTLMDGNFNAHSELIRFGLSYRLF
jgi:hypothetical protein